MRYVSHLSTSSSPTRASHPQQKFLDAQAKANYVSYWEKKQVTNDTVETYINLFKNLRERAEDLKDAVDKLTAAKAELESLRTSLDDHMSACTATGE